MDDVTEAAGKGEIKWERIKQNQRWKAINKIIQKS